MKADLFIKEGIVIPAHELEITTSKAGGHGGQHVNKTDTRVTIRWNIKNTHILSFEEKERVLKNLHTQISTEGDLIIHNSETRSQVQNKQLALKHMAQELQKALYVPKKRIKTKLSITDKEERLKEKLHRSKTKKLRTKKIEYD